MPPAGAVRRMAAAAALLLFGALGAGAAQGAGLAVAPLSLTLEPGEQATAVTVTNRDDHPWVIQADVKRWTQPDGHDHYQSDANLLATPALFRIASNAKQVVRVGFSGGPATAGETEQAFRLFISEVPPQRSAPEAAHTGEPAGVQFLLHLVLPVFLPPARAVTRPQWSLVGNDAAPALRLRNDGNVHLRLVEVSIADAAGKTVFDEHGLWYVLAGAYHDWPLRVSRSRLQRPLHISARTENSTFSADVVPGH